MKGKRINCLSETDRIAFEMLAHCGNATTGTLQKAGLTQSRIEGMMRDRLIASVDKDQKYQHKNENAVWALTPSGKTFAEKNLGIERFASGSNAPRHNCAVAVEYAEILKRDDIKTIMGEHECRSFIRENLEELCRMSERSEEFYEWKDRLDSGRMSMPDITIVTTSETIECIEVVTNNYGEAEIASKIMTVEFLSAAYTQIDI